MNKTATTAGKGEGDGRGGVVREQLGFGTKYVSDLTAAEKAASGGRGRRPTGTAGAGRSRSSFRPSSACSGAARAP